MVSVALVDALPFLTKVVPGVALVFKLAMVALLPLRLNVPVFDPKPKLTAFSNPALEFNAAVLPSVTVPASMVSPPVKVLVPLSVKVPLPDLVMEPVVVAIAPVTVVSPAPSTIIFCAVPVTDAKVSSDPVLTVNVGAPVRVVAPKAIPAVPESEIKLPPLPMVRVCVPMESVPRVCVAPVPLRAALSDLIVAFAVIVVLRLKETPLLLANSKVPPAMESVPAPSALAADARNVPAESVTTPDRPELSPDKTNLPLPDFVRPLAPVNLTEIDDV